MGLLALVLCLINVLLVGFIIFVKAPHPDGEGPRKVIVEKLHFDATQTEQYDALIATHRKEIREANTKIMLLKNQLYSNLINQDRQANKDSLITEINKVQQQIEQIHYAHFVDIKKLCKLEQQVYFQALTKELAALFAPPRPGKK